jgi:hypothetical protein
MSTQAMELYEGTGSALSLSRTPELVLEEAGRAAKALKDVVVKTKAAIMLGTSEHLKCEAWQTLGHFYGLTGRIRETRFVEFGEVKGFHAFSELVHVKSGVVISTAESMCLNDEDKWSSRTKYQYVYVKKSGGTSVEDPGKDEIIWEDNPAKPGKKLPKKQKVATGEERVPLFQLMSMAETRALSKVHSNALRWIVVLAGYNPTPAEEVEGQTLNEEGQMQTTQQTPQMPKRKSESAPPLDDQIPFDQLSSTPPTQGTSTSQPALPTNGNVITEKQVGRLYAIARGAGYTDETLHAALAKMGYKSSKDVTRASYEDVCTFFAQKP